MESIHAFLKKYDHIPPREKCMDLLVAEERFLKVKQALEEGQNQSENVQELLLKLLNDLQILNKMKLKQEEQVAKIFAIAPDFPITDSLIMEDEHLDTISKTESEEENESSVEDLNLTPSEFEDLSDIESEILFLVSSPKFDSLLEEFSGELAHIDLIFPEINESDLDPEQEGSDSFMEKIDIFLAPDDSIPSSIENDDYDSKGDILEEFLNNDSLSLPKNESFHFDHYYNPSSPILLQNHRMMMQFNLMLSPIREF
nr:hypothetical protein [Tanacetum cinerariifolium]